MHNVEFKAELRDLPLARSIVRSLGARFIVKMNQTDTYYRTPTGRLKRRECEGEPTEYIHYERADRVLPKLSHFTIYSEERFREVFGIEPLPVWLTVRKVRELFMLGNVRIHLDQVETLGDFVEFEALVSPDHTVPTCHRAIAELREKLGPVLGEPISAGYSDLLERANSRD
jgi:adenylate cyclase class 2